MRFDNSQKALKIQMLKRLVAVLAAVIIALFFTTNLGDFIQNKTGVSRILLVLLVASIYIAYYMYHVLVASSFISYSDDEGKIILRFYQLNMFNTSKNSFEIPKSEFSGYRILYTMLNLKQELILYRKHKGNAVKYPPISISSLTMDEKSKLVSSLNTYAPKTL